MDSGFKDDVAIHGALLGIDVNSNGTVTGVQSGLRLDVTGASTASGALVELWTCNDQSSQQWKLG
ncbi:hypothetical protein GCM10009838_17940 [Catenulispora subtropica]|uniref:Ricin B lectin domain-containing protein n=1 Tax=Catenulispora subtropica TaxID=450798 RepID=A0ABP5CCI0_9ACTN